MMDSDPAGAADCRPVRDITAGFTRVPNVAVNRLESIGFVAIKVYLRLCRTADDSGSTRVLRKTLAKRIGVTERAVGNGLTELRKAGLISWRRTKFASIYQIANWPTRQKENVPFRQDAQAANIASSFEPQEGNDASSHRSRMEPGLPQEVNERSCKRGTTVPINQEVYIQEGKDAPIGFSNYRQQNRKQQFVPPTVDQVTNYCHEQKLTETVPEVFVDHFKSNGWLVSGKAPMQDWRAAARNWNRRQIEFERTSGNSKSTNEYKLLTPPKPATRAS